MTSLDHVADDAGAKHFRIGVAKVCSLFAKGSAKPVNDDDIAHTVVRHGIKNDVQTRAGSEPYAGPCYILPRNRYFLSSLKYQSLPYFEGGRQILGYKQ